MAQQPTLHSARLTLRPFAQADAPVVQHLAGAYEVAATTLLIPHPYPDGAAEAWIATHGNAYATGQAATFAITQRESGVLMGAVGLGMPDEHARSEIGYWLGVPFWNQGYVSEAARAVVDYGFTALALNRIHAAHFAHNPASGRVMQKIGMTYEGTLRQHYLKWGQFVDALLYAILRSEWAEQTG